MIDYGKKWIHDNISAIVKFGYIHIDDKDKQRIIEIELAQRHIAYKVYGDKCKMYEIVR